MPVLRGRRFLLLRERCNETPQVAECGGVALMATGALKQAVIVAMPGALSTVAAEA